MGHDLICKPCVILTSAVPPDGHAYGVMRSLGQKGVPVYVITVGDSSAYTKMYSKSRFCVFADHISWNLMLNVSVTKLFNGDKKKDLLKIQL